MSPASDGAPSAGPPGAGEERNQRDDAVASGEFTTLLLRREPAA